MYRFKSTVHALHLLIRLSLLLVIKTILEIMFVTRIIGEFDIYTHHVSLHPPIRLMKTIILSKSETLPECSPLEPRTMKIKGFVDHHQDRLYRLEAELVGATDYLGSGVWVG
jgi:hypothetical protein